jgi:hypothetical protein
LIKGWRFGTDRLVSNGVVFDEFVKTELDESGKVIELAVPGGDAPVPVIGILPFVIGNGTDERAPEVGLGRLETPVPGMVDAAVPELA